MLKGAVDDLDLVGRRRGVDRAAPVGAVGSWVGPPEPSITVVNLCSMPQPATAELKRLELNLGLRDRDALPCGLHREGEVCQGLVGHKGRAEQCREGPPHGET